MTELGKETSRSDNRLSTDYEAAASVSCECLLEMKSPGSHPLVAPGAAFYSDVWGTITCMSEKEETVLIEVLEGAKHLPYIGAP